MNKKTEACVPRLRFAEFVGAGEWVEKKIISIADKQVRWSFTGGPFGSNLKSSDYTPAGIRIIQLQNMGDGEFLSEYKIFTSKEKADELLSCNIYPGELILAKMGDPVGRACIIPDEHDRYVMCSDGIRFVVDEKQFSKYFIFSSLNSPQFKGILDSVATGSTRKRIGLDELKNIQLQVPTLPEQQKIADCLSSLDTLLTAHNAKLDALKQYKKGLLQQLFPAEGERVPRLRFAEFAGAGEWVEKKLGDDALGTFTGGGTPDTSNTRYWEGTIPWISSADISEDNIYDINCSRYITQEAVNNSATKLVPPNSIIIVTRVGVGKIAVTDTTICTSQDFTSLIPREDVALFLAYTIMEKVKKLAKFNQGTSIKGILKSDLEELIIYLPILPEQQKIADCLSSLDALITAQGEKIAALKEHKKGLLQQLFPQDEGAGA